MTRRGPDRETRCSWGTNEEQTIHINFDVCSSFGGGAKGEVAPPPNQHTPITTDPMRNKRTFLYISVEQTKKKRTNIVSSFVLHFGGPTSPSWPSGVEKIENFK